MPRLPFLRGLLPRLTARPLLPVTRLITPHAPPRAFSLPFSRSFYTSRIRLTSSPSSSSPPHSPSSPQAQPQTLSARLKTLIKYYGWYALGVYLVLSALDFSVAFAAINLLGAEHVSRVTASVKAYVLDLVGHTPQEQPDPAVQQGGQDGLYIMLVLAYTVHKTLFVPVRVGLTAAVTPKFVSWLSKRGWVGSDGARRAAQQVRERMRRGSRGSNNSPTD